MRAPADHPTNRRQRSEAQGRRHIFLRSSRQRYSPLAPDALHAALRPRLHVNPGHEIGRVSADEIMADVIRRARLPRIPRPVLHACRTRRRSWRPTSTSRRGTGGFPAACCTRARASGLHPRPQRRSERLPQLPPARPALRDRLRRRVALGRTDARTAAAATRYGPARRWTYVFDATDDTIGAWAFHDHVRNVQANVNRGLFGALIVRDPAAPRPDHEIPLFVHQLAGAVAGRQPSRARRSGTARRTPTPSPPPDDREVPLPHSRASMAGTSVVDPARPPAIGRWRSATTSSNPARSHPAARRDLDQRRQPSTTSSSRAGGGEATFCLNGRAFIGNTPTIEVSPGKRLRWYFCNLDFGSVWHNFHPHSSALAAADADRRRHRRALAEPVADVRDGHRGPAGAPRLPCSLEELQCDPPDSACRVRIKGEFLFHCHVEAHMMSGLAGLVRWRDSSGSRRACSPRQNLELPLDDGRNDCPPVDFFRCQPRPRAIPTAEPGRS